MTQLKFAAVSRNYFNMPVWIAKHQGMFSDEGLDVAIELYEGVDEVTDRLREGRAQLAYGITEHVVLDSEALAAAHDFCAATVVIHPDDHAAYDRVLTCLSPDAAARFGPPFCVYRPRCAPSCGIRLLKAYKRS